MRCAGSHHAPPRWMGKRADYSVSRRVDKTALPGELARPVHIFWCNRWTDRAIMPPRPQRTRVPELLAAVEGSTQMGDAEASPVHPSVTPKFAPSLAP
jgi:hypothetical protein